MYIEIALKYTKMTKSKKTPKTRQTIDFNGTQRNNTYFHILLDDYHAFGLLL